MQEGVGWATSEAHGRPPAQHGRLEWAAHFPIPYSARRPTPTRRPPVYAPAEVLSPPPVCMKLSLFLAGLALVAAPAAAATPDCTATQKREVNTLLSTSSGTGKSCYEAVGKEDITKLDTSDLCPVEECAAWIKDVAENAPDCYYGDTNFADLYAKKLEDCPSSGSASASDTAGSSSESSASASESSSASSSGSSSSNSTTSTTKKPTTKKSSSGSAETEVGDTSSSGSEDLSVDTIDTPAPTEDTTVETLAPEASDSGSSGSPTGSSSSGAASLVTGSLAVVVAATVAATGATF